MKVDLLASLKYRISPFMSFTNFRPMSKLHPLLTHLHHFQTFGSIVIQGEFNLFKIQVAVNDAIKVRISKSHVHLDTHAQKAAHT